MKVVEFFYDVASPFSWFAFETLTRYRPLWNLDLRFKPIFLGGVFHAIRDGRPPSLNPLKEAYSTIDLQRLPKYFGLPFSRPKNIWNVLIEKSTLKPQRFITAVNQTNPQYTEELSRQLWMRIYVQDADVTEPESLREAAEKSGMNAKVIKDALARMSSVEVKNLLKSTTQEVLDLGAFGAPFIVVHVDDRKEVFFGSDRFHLMAMIIGEKWRGPQPHVKQPYEEYTVAERSIAP